MKMYYGNTPIKSLNIKHYEMDTNSATMIPSDLQAGVTAFAKGKKVTGTGKSFEFAMYGGLKTNFPTPLPSLINVIEVACKDYPIQLTVELKNMKNMDFSTAQSVANVIIDGETYPITVQLSNNIMTVGCSKTFNMQIFYGKDNYV